ncbi:hypothetical protein PHSY_007176 [Pseudozyma hubeiensis SY62]|uniref:Uncharacterized protein n=1 Tax=Pseudozyma hubeiensis (strain SY62) TaxID=1305764 RepID=R9PDX8_PSEHS|nr:hypothetical protein PHSY_007176 [Pseudozyma hubeiensis SY62]GAC99574.1 hypothetical protein PHSY_007176 [Pseudozyma hubeiensis SY62]
MSSIVTIKDGWNMTIVNNGSFSDNSRNFCSINVAGSSSHGCNLTITSNAGRSGSFTTIVQTSGGWICDSRRNNPVQLPRLENGGQGAEQTKSFLTTYHNVPQHRLKAFEATAANIPYFWSVEHGVYTLVGKTCNVRVNWFVPEKYFTVVMGRAFGLMGFEVFDPPANARAGLFDEIECVRKQMRKGVVYPIDDENI